MEGICIRSNVVNITRYFIRSYRRSVAAWPSNEMRNWRPKPVAHVLAMNHNQMINTKSMKLPISILQISRRKYTNDVSGKTDKTPPDAGSTSAFPLQMKEFERLLERQEVEEAALLLVRVAVNAVDDFAKKLHVVFPEGYKAGLSAREEFLICCDYVLNESEKYGTEKWYLSTLWGIPCWLYEEQDREWLRNSGPSVKKCANVIKALVNALNDLDHSEVDEDLLKEFSSESGYQIVKNN